MHWFDRPEAVADRPAVFTTAGDAPWKLARHRRSCHTRHRTWPQEGFCRDRRWGYDVIMPMPW